MTEQEAVSGLFSATPLPMFVLDAAAGRVLAANEAALDRYGLEPAMVAGLDPSSLVPAALARSFRHWAEAGDGSPTEAFEQRTADGVSFAAELRVTRLRWGGEDARLLIVRDVSARMRNEERLRQAQKMEAIGRLAGSIAHDFNNLLTAIGGYADLLAGGLDPDDPAVDDAREIRRAVDRGAALTRQLLAFSRRQLVQTQVVDLNQSVHGMRPLLERLLGEHVRLTLGLGPLAGARADRPRPARAGAAQPRAQRPRRDARGRAAARRDRAGRARRALRGRAPGRDARHATRSSPCPTRDAA